MIASWFGKMNGANTFPLPQGSPLITVNATSVLEQSDESSGGNGGWYGRCSIYERPDGIIVRTYREGEAHHLNLYDRIHIKFSADYGQTWSEQNKYLNGTSVTGFPMWPTTGVYAVDAKGGVHGLLVGCPNGDILVFMWCSDYAGDNDGTHMSRSTDGGLTWSTPAKITYQNTALNQNRIFFGEGHTVVDNVIYAAARYYNTDSPVSEANYLVVSTDNGITWTFRGQLSTPTDPAPRGTQEMSIEYVGNGRFVSLLREAGNSDGWFSYSNDFGYTWSTLVDVTAALGIGSTSWLGRTQMKTRAHLKKQYNWWNDRVLIVTGFVGGSDGVSTGARQNASWVGIIPIDYNLANIAWYGPFYLDVVGYDGGYGDMFYNPNLKQFVFCSYRSPVDYYGGSTKQYNFTLSFA
jgi:hypothetical protein